MKDIPGVGFLIKTISEWMIEKAHKKYLEYSRDALRELYRDGELKRPFEISDLLPWMLAQDLNCHLHDHPDERFVLFIDDYDKILGRNEVIRGQGNSSLDDRVRTLVRESNGLLVVFFSRVRLRWNADPDWSDDLEGNQHPLEGLSDSDSDTFLRAVPIEDEATRTAMIAGARETLSSEASVYPLMLSMQVEHWRGLKARGEPITSHSFCLTAEGFKGRCNEIVKRVVSDSGEEIQATFRRLACARWFDRKMFEHVVAAFQTGMAFDRFQELLDFTFVTASRDGHAAIHSVIAEALRESLDETARHATVIELFRHCCSRIRQQSHAEITDDTVKVLIEASFLGQSAGLSDYAAWLNSAVQPVMSAARYSDAIQIWRDALGYLDLVVGPEHPDFALALSQLGYLLDKVGDLAGAFDFFDRALGVYEKALGPDHGHTATILNNLGYLLSRRGEYGSARSVLERALAISERTLEHDSREIAVRLDNLANVLCHLGETQRAKSMFERALAIMERHAGFDHSETALHLNNLAGLLLSERDPNGARRLYERALSICEIQLGPKHPDTGTAFSSLATALADLGDIDGALGAAERALEIHQGVFGVDHPDVARDLNNLASLREASGELAQSRLLYERALGVCERVYRPDHPHIGTILTNLGRVLLLEGNEDHAKQLFERALRISEQNFGVDHPKNLKSLRKLGSLLKQQFAFAEAQDIYERALAIAESAYGPNHNETALGLLNLSYVLGAQGDLGSARPLNERALAIYERNLGPEHEYTTIALENLAVLLAVQGEVTGDGRAYERAAAIREARQMDLGRWGQRTGPTRIL